MAVSKELQTWFDLQRETLTRVHASWVPDIPVELLTLACKNAVGRRWLAKRLRADGSKLFERPAQIDASVTSSLADSSWLTPLLRDSLECALDLGSLALAATVRTIVTRSAVAKLRATLGAARYTRVLTSGSQASQAQRPDASAGSDETDIVDRLIRCGAAELAAYATSLHPAWGESVRLTFERGWWQSPPASQLIPDVAGATLRLREQPP